MKKLSVLMIAIIALSISISITFAQAGPDRDGDGVDDSVDSCISDIGPASNNGCPVPADTTTTDTSTTDTSTTDTTTTNNPDDRDGDGTNDVSDNCPDSGGPSSNAGCPIDDTTTQPEPTAEPTVVPLLPLPTTGDCVVATATNSRVNVRSFPSLDAPIIGVLEPEPQAAAYLKFDGVEGESMILTPLGFIAESVLRFGGENCDERPTMDIPTGTGPFVLRQDGDGATEGDFNADGVVDFQYAILPQADVFPNPFDGTIFLPPVEGDDDMTPIMHSIMLTDGNGIMAEPGQTCGDLFIAEDVPGCIGHNGDVLVFCIEDYCFSKEDTQQAGLLDLDLINSTVFVPTIPTTDFDAQARLILGSMVSEPINPLDRLIFVPPNPPGGTQGDLDDCENVSIGNDNVSINGCLYMNLDLIAFCISDICVYHEW